MDASGSLPMCDETALHMMAFLDDPALFVLATTSKHVRTLCQAPRFWKTVWMMDKSVEYWRCAMHLARDVVETLFVYPLTPSLWDLIMQTTRLKRLYAVCEEGDTTNFCFTGKLQLQEVYCTGNFSGNITDVPRLRVSVGVSWSGVMAPLQHKHLQYWDVNANPLTTFLSSLCCFPQLTSVTIDGNVCIDCHPRDLPHLKSLTAPGLFVHQLLEQKGPRWDVVLGRLECLRILSLPKSSSNMSRLSITNLHTLHLTFPPTQLLVELTPGVRRASVSGVRNLDTVALWPDLCALDVLSNKATVMVVGPKMTSLRCLRIASKSLRMLRRCREATRLSLEYISLPYSENLNPQSLIHDFPRVRYLGVGLDLWRDPLSAFHSLNHLRGLTLFHNSPHTGGCCQALLQGVPVQDLLLDCVRGNHCRCWAFPSTRGRTEVGDRFFPQQCEEPWVFDVELRHFFDRFYNTLD